ncbi:MAG: hypothetical protein MUD14_08155 [Hydrococcus sp. Prado102]|jgi:hypothetical protein|nr:hypothetical protein [Hydrococcus sp. Prado102]
MFNAFINWFNNSLVQSVLISPLMGVVFGALFSGLDRSPTKNAPVTVIETRREYYRERIIYREKEVNKSVNNGLLSILIAATAGVIFLAWKYIAYSNIILKYFLIFLLTALSFSGTTIVVSILKGHFNSRSWWYYVAFPFLCIAILFILTPGC